MGLLWVFALSTENATGVLARLLHEHRGDFPSSKSYNLPQLTKPQGQKLGRDHHGNQLAALFPPPIWSRRSSFWTIIALNAHLPTPTLPL